MPEPVHLTEMQEKIREICDQIRDLLLDKNRKYGNSVLEPRQVHSKVDPIEQINVRLDDKLKRMESAQGDDLEDAKLDYIGYLILKYVVEKMLEEQADHDGDFTID